LKTAQYFGILALAAWAAAAAADTTVHAVTALPNTPGFTVLADPKNDSTRDLVNAMNDYYFSQLIINNAEGARNDFNDRIRWEFHLGVAGAVDPKYVPAGPDFWHGVGTERFFTMGIKYNLNNPKIVNPNDVRSELQRLRHLLKVRSYAFNDDIDAESARMLQELQDYDSRFWFKRWSLGIDFPWVTQGQSFNYNQNGPLGSGGYNLNINTGNGAGLDYGDPFFYLGSDLGDSLTLKLGYSAQNQVMLGLSMDFSTPVFTYAAQFFTYLRTFSGAPAATAAFPANIPGF
jgi:hypothetical protein